MSEHAHYQAELKARLYEAVFGTNLAEDAARPAEEAEEQAPSYPLPLEATMQEAARLLALLIALHPSLRTRPARIKFLEEALPGIEESARCFIRDGVKPARPISPGGHA